jgi:hypothetical protein
MSVDQAKEKPYEGAGPIWDRITLYVPWFGLLGFLVFFGIYILPMFRPVFEKLQEKGGLPPLVAILIHFDQLNEAWYYSPALLLAVGFVVCNEAMFSYLGRRAHGRLWSTHWSSAMFLAFLLIVVIGMRALTLPVGKTSA